MGMGSSGGDASAAADFGETDATRVGAAAAGSVLVRGLLFANTHAAVKRYVGLGFYFLEGRKGRKGRRFVLFCCYLFVVV